MRAWYSGVCPNCARLNVPNFSPPVKYFVLSPLPMAAMSVELSLPAPTISVGVPFGFPCMNVFGRKVNAWLPKTIPLLR